MRHLPFWIRWSWRDLRKRWLLVTAIALTIGVGTGAYGGLTSTSAWRLAANDASYAALRMFDVRVRLMNQGVVPAGSLAIIARSIESSDGIAELEERLVLATQVDASIDGRTIIVPGQAIGVDVTLPAHIAGMSARLGRALEPGDAGLHVAALDFHFARELELPAQGELRIPGGTSLTYVGQVLTPEFFLVTTAGGGLLADANFAALVVPLDTLQYRTGNEGKVNDVLIRLTPGADVEAVRTEIEDALRQELPGLTVDVDLAAEDEAYRVLYENIDSDDRFYFIFALVILAGATLAAFNLTSRVVESQRREIGIGMALGLAPRWIAFRPLLIGAQVAALGVVLGIGVGLLIDVGMDGLLQRYFPMPIWSAPFQPGAFAQAAVVGFLLPFAASVYPVWRAVSVPPIRAIRTGSTSASGIGLAHLARRLRLPGGPLRQMPLRNVLRTPRRTALTSIGVAAAIAVFVGTTGMIDTFLRTIDIGEHEVIGDEPRRLSVTLTGFEPAAAVEERLAATNVLGRIEPELVVTGTAKHAGRELDLSISLLDTARAGWTPTIIEGRLPRTTDPQEPPEILMSAAGADQLGVRVGDVVSLAHSFREETGIVNRATDVVLVGLQPSPSKSLVGMDLGEAGRFGLAGLTNQLSVIPANDETIEAVQRGLFDVAGIAAAEPVATTAAIFRNIVDQYLGLLAIVQITGLALALLIAFNTATIALDERAREHATMFAFGIGVRAVLAMAIAESVIIGIVGTALGIVGGRLLVEFIVRFIMVDVVPDIGFTTLLSAGTIAIASLLGIAIVGLAPLVGVRRLRNTNIPDALRVVE